MEIRLTISRRSLLAAAAALPLVRLPEVTHPMCSFDRRQAIELIGLIRSNPMYEGRYDLLPLIREVTHD